MTAPVGAVARLKYAVIWFLDWIVDVRILRHRFQRFCDWLATHPWWGEHACEHAPVEIDGRLYCAHCGVRIG